MKTITGSSVRLFRTFLVPIRTLALSSVLALVFAACSGGAAEKPDKLVIWSFYEGAPEVAADAFSAETGTEVEFIISGWTDFQQKLTTSLGSDEEPDLAFLEATFVTPFLAGGYFYDLDEIWKDKEAFQAYKQNTVELTQAPGRFDGKTYGVGWESTVWAYWYREDIAREAYGINSVEEMEGILAAGVKDGFLDLQARKQPGNENIKEIGNADRWRSILMESGDFPLVKNGKFHIPSTYIQVLEDGKELADAGIFYTYGPDQQIQPGLVDGSILGVIAGSWYIDTLRKLEQTGLWRVAEMPISIASGGTWAVVPKTGGNPDIAYDFLSATLMNEDYLSENIGAFGNFVGNQNVMKQLLSGGSDLSDAYFGGQNLSAKLNEIATSPNLYIAEHSIYFLSVNEPLASGVQGYIWDGVFATVDEAIDSALKQIKTNLPDIEITQ